MKCPWCGEELDCTDSDFNIYECSNVDHKLDDYEKVFHLNDTGELMDGTPF